MGPKSAKERPEALANAPEGFGGNAPADALSEAPGPEPRKTTTTLKQRGVVTIPSQIRKAARLEEGDPIEVEMTDEGILLRPMKLIDATQAWFWTPGWQAKEREADEDAAAGRGKVFSSDEEFLAYLDGLAERATKKRRSPGS